MADKEILSNFTIFSDMSHDSLTEIAQRAEILEFGPDDDIFQQDEPAQDFYGLLEGEVALIIMYAEKEVKHDINYEESILMKDEILERPIEIDTIHPSEVFGWSAVITPPGQWTATARCVEKSKVFCIKADELREIFDINPKQGYIFIGRLSAIIAKRLHHRQEKLVEAWAEAFGAHKI
jgi:CRP-like cAMP-binding protein